MMTSRSRRRCPARRPRRIIERDATVVSPSYTRDYPLVIARGEGAVVEDVDGNVFLDCAAGIAVNSTGHSHPDVVKAIAEQAQKFLHMSGTDFYYEPQVRLAEELADDRRRSTAACDRSSATPAPKRSRRAIKLARYHTKRAGHHRVPRRVPRPHAWARSSLTASKAIQRRGFGPLHAGRVSRAVSRLLSLSGRHVARDVRRGVPRLHRAAALRAPRLARRSRGDRRRADSGRGRLRRRRPTSSCSGCAS